LQGFLLQVEISKIAVHEADEPNALVDFPDAELWPAGTMEMLIFLQCGQRRPQEVTTTSRWWLDGPGPM
jgi:hypothetical protein